MPRQNFVLQINLTSCLCRKGGLGKDLMATDSRAAGLKSFIVDVFDCFQGLVLHTTSDDFNKDDKEAL